MFDHRKKKVRGMRRRLRQLDKWADSNKIPIISGESDHCSLKLTIDPWYRLLQTDPPGWLKKKMSCLLIELYKSWNEYLKANYNNYYLKLWFYDERFINSQLVAAVGERTGLYKNAFKENKEVKDFPASKFGFENESDFKWECFFDEEPFLEEADGCEYTEEELREIISKSHRKEKSPSTGEIIYYIKYGNVWTGNLIN